jgi:hypothetical protein
MSDDFGTVNLNRDQRSREIEVLRANYRRHREALKRMAAEAPTDQLAQEYQRLVLSIEGSLAKLDELEGAAPAPRLKTGPGMTPLTQPLAEPVYDDDATQVDYEPPVGTPVSNLRLAMIVAAGVLVLALIAWLIWRASSDRGAAPTATTTAADTVVETTTSSATEPAAEAAAATQTAAAAGDPLSVSPQAQDYGTIRKGTRATRQFDVLNSGTEPMTMVVARSACRCLYYEYRGTVPPKGRESITVTIDGAKAKAGELAETVKVSVKNDPAIVTSFDVTATIR